MTRHRTEEAYRRRVDVAWDRVAFGTHCVDCYPNNCPVYVFVKDGKVVREEAAGNLETVEPGVPDMNPMGCQKGASWPEQIHAPDRILHPMRRAGARGEGRWERISWDEALADTADAILDAIAEIGPQAVVHEVSPEISVVPAAARFMNVLGATALDVNSTINDFWAGFHQTLGKFYFAASVDDVFHADCIVVWHANPAYTAIPSFHYLVEARYRGAELVLISPDVSPSHSHVDFHVPVRHGTDAALALAMCQTILAERRADLGFVRSQTDLALLVRTDSGEFLRQGHLERGGRDDRFYHRHPERGVVPADPASLLLDFDPMLDGVLEIELADGGRVTVEPLFARLRRRLDADYTPEIAAGICGTHPETIRTVARKIAAGRTRLLIGAGATKYFHGDLMTRAMLLLLALTGNWGKKGCGTSGWCSSLFDGNLMAIAKLKPGAAGAVEMRDALDMMAAAMQSQDPTLTGELSRNAVWRMIGPATGMSPPAFFWYWHMGYRERWNRRDWSDPTMARDFDAYFDEAIAANWWGDAARPRPESPPRVLLEIGGNILRRSRGGQGVVLDKLWPQLERIVCMDYRMSYTAQYADILLPATQHYEKTTFNMPTPWTMFLTMSDAVTPPAGEARSEWEVLAALCRTLGERAAARGLETYTDRNGVVHRYDRLWDDYTLQGALVDDQTTAADMLESSVAVGNLPPGTTLATFRERGWCRYADWGMTAFARGQASPFPTGETHAPLRNHVELGHPYPTLTRRAQFLLDHPWYREAGEDLPTHKDPPPMGGTHAFVLSSGHSRWSVHAMNMTNRLILETHRGKPFVLINDADARAKGIADDALVRVWNDVGEFVVAARTSPAQRPGALTVYNGFEGFAFPGGKGANEVEPGLVKWLHLVAGYGHLTFTPIEWQPTPTDRCVFVDCEAYRADGSAAGCSRGGRACDD
jgi:DMSO reductase family type II enzyme molybdopterin subunit